MSYSRARNDINYTYENRTQDTNRINKGKEAKPVINAHIDMTLLIAILILVLFGVIMVFSSSYYHDLDKYGDMFNLLKKQLLWVSLGLLAMYATFKFPYFYYRRLAFLSYWISNALLVLVLFFGVERNFSKRWFVIFGVQFQPSELAKITLILYLSMYIAYNIKKVKTTKGFLTCLGIIGIPFVLIAIENLSTALVVGAIGASIMFVSIMTIKFFIGIVAAAAAVLVPFITLFSYRIGRIKAWLDPFADPTGDGFQIVQSLYAIASGGLFGLGLGESRQKLGYIPEAYNDIIFAIICEELGFMGAAFVLGLFMVLAWRGIKVAINAQNLFGSLIAFGIVAMIGIQVLINVAVVTNTMPVTGMALPFISYGGTALVMTMACMGILLNISQYAKQ